MTSRTSSQKAVVPLNTGQLATSSVCNQKQPIIVNAVPVQLRQLLKRFYDLEEGADLYVLPNDPNKLFVLYRGQLRTVDLSARETSQQGSIHSQVGSDDLKVSPKSSLEEAKKDGQVAPPATPVTQLRTSSTTGHRLHESEWLKAVSDQEREFLQRERRRMNAYKTSLCNSFRDTGRCPYGFQCRFAHGINELLPAPRPHPKYKTQLCNKFALYGSCPYGSHCQFIHMRPCKLQNNLGYVNFATNLDSVGKHALNYRHYAMSGRPRFCGQKPCAVEVPGFGYCNSLPQYRSIIDSNRLNFNATAMNDLGNLFSTMNIDEDRTRFSQSCFPRINM